MKIECPKIVKPLRLSEYAEEFGETCLQVWVNPPRELRAGYDQLSARSRAAFQKLAGLPKEQAEEIRAVRDEITAVGGAAMEIVSQLWSQGAEETRMPVEAIRELIDGTRDTDPQLYGWLVDRTIGMIREHRADRKKV